MKKQSTVTRRKFIKTAAVGAVAAGFAPNILRADEVVVGDKDHKYKWDSNWAKLPEGKKFGNAHSASVTQDGRVFIHHTNADSVCIFEPNGKFIESWGKEYASGAHGMQLRKEGDSESLYFATTGQRSIVKTDLKGKVIWKLDGPPKEHEFYSTPKGKDKNGKDVFPNYTPTNIALMPAEGDIYVADGYGSHYIHQYTKDGKFVRAFGGHKANIKDLGSINSPHGLFLDQRSGEPIVCVADRENNRIQNFKPDGTPINVVAEELRRPCHFDTFGTDLLIPDLAGRVTIFDKNNKLIVHLGDQPDPKKRAANGVPQKDWKDGEFYTPHGCSYDKDGNIYITEWLSNPCGRVTKLTRIA